MRLIAQVTEAMDAAAMQEQLAQVTMQLKILNRAHPTGTIEEDMAALQGNISNTKLVMSAIEKLNGTAGLPTSPDDSNSVEKEAQEIEQEILAGAGWAESEDVPTAPQTVPRTALALNLPDAAVELDLESRLAALRERT